MDGIWFWAAAVAAAVFVGAGKGGIPVVGMLGVPVLALAINPVTAAGLLLPVYVVSDMFGLWAYRREFDRRVLAILLPGAVAGIGLGWATASVVSEAVVTGLIGAIGVVFALNLILRPGGDAEPKRAEVAPGRQPFGRAALSGLYAAPEDDEDGLCGDVHHRFRGDQCGEVDPLLGAWAVFVGKSACCGPADACGGAGGVCRGAAGAGAARGAVLHW